MRPRPPAQRRRQIRGDFMGWFNVYGSFRQIIQDLVAPSLEAIQGQLEAINARVDALNIKLDARIDGLDAKIDGQNTRIDVLDTKIDVLDIKIESMRSSLDAKIESLRAEVHGLRGEFQELRLDVRQKWDQSLEVHERLAAVDAKLEHGPSDAAVDSRICSGRNGPGGDISWPDARISGQLARRRAAS